MKFSVLVLSVTCAISTRSISSSWIGSGGPGKRCSNLFDGSCSNGQLPGAASHEDWLHSGSPGKRCNNLFDGSCSNGQLPGAAAHDDWLQSGSPGKRCIGGECNGPILQDSDWLIAHAPGKRACILDSSCGNNGVSDAAADEDWKHSNSPGRRFLNGNIDWGVGNAGIPSDNDWIDNGNSPGK